MNRKRLRGGFSLLELMVSISVTAALLAVTVGWMHQTMKCSSQIKQRQHHHLNITRLAVSLREQVRDCDSISMENEHQLTLQWRDGTRASYRIEGDRIRFEKIDGSSPGNGLPVVREVFPVSKQSSVQWESSEMPEWISLVVSRTRERVTNVDADERGPIDLHVRVAPNRWQRASRSGQETVAGGSR